MPPIARRDRIILQRWLAAVGLIRSAEESARIDTPETNASALLSAHAACEALLGLIAGVQPYKRGEDIPFGRLLAKSATRARLRRDVTDDLDAVHRMRNDFVHASTAIHASEAGRAIDSARRLLDIAPRRVTGVFALSGSGGIGSAVASIIDVEAVGMWLRHADEMLRKGRLELAADGCARALDAAINRTKPRLYKDQRLSREASSMDLDHYASGTGRDRLRGALASRIEGLDAWVLPLALGLSPAAYVHLRGLVGRQEDYDLRGGPVPVRRPATPPDRDGVRQALSTTAEIVFRLWASGVLVPWERDDRIVELAAPFLADPSGLAAGEPPGGGHRSQVSRR